MNKIIILFFVLIGCTHSQQPENKSVTSQTSSTVGTDSSSLDEYWILTDYYDNILKYKTIAKYRLLPISWQAMLLKISGNKTYASGLINLMFKEIPSDFKSDTVGSIDDFWTGVFVLNRITGYIEAKGISTNGDDKIYKYRRVNDSFLKTMLSKDTLWLEQVFTQIFIDSILVGRYVSLDNDSNALQLLSDGRAYGFKGYESFKIHSYFGTLHNFGNEDIINFSGNFYSWKFNGNQFTLTEMYEIPESDNYQLGKIKYRFRRIKN